MADQKGSRPTQLKKRVRPLLTLVHAACRWTLFTGPPLTADERAQMLNLFCQRDAMRSPSDVTNAFSSIGVNAPIEETTRYFSRLHINEASGIVVTWAQFEKIARYVKRRFEIDSMIPDSQAAFFALVGERDTSAVIETERLKQVCQEEFCLTVDVGTLVSTTSHRADDEAPGKLGLREFESMFLSDDSRVDEDEPRALRDLQENSTTQRIAAAADSNGLQLHPLVYFDERGMLQASRLLMHGPALGSDNRTVARRATAAIFSQSAQSVSQLMTSSDRLQLSAMVRSQRHALATANNSLNLDGAATVFDACRGWMQADPFAALGQRPSSSRSRQQTTTVTFVSGLDKSQSAEPLLTESTSATTPPVEERPTSIIIAIPPLAANDAPRPAPHWKRSMTARGEGATGASVDEGRHAARKLVVKTIATSFGSTRRFVTDPPLEPLPPPPRTASRSLRSLQLGAGDGVRLSRRSRDGERSRPQRLCVELPAVFEARSGKTNVLCQPEMVF